VAIALAAASPNRRTEADDYAAPPRQAESRHESPALKQSSETRDSTGSLQLETWKNKVVGRLRAADLGAFDYHDYQLSDRQLRLADMLTGKLSQAAYAAQERGPDFFDLYGFSKASAGVGAVDWTATSTDPVILEKSQYGPFFFSQPLAAAYWKTGDPTYLTAWFAIAGDFARNQKRQILEIPVAKRRMDNAPWVAGGLPALHQAYRTITMLRCLGVFAKSLPAEGDSDKPSWPMVLRPLNSPPRPASLALIPLPELEDIVHLLAVEHPKLLLESYYEPGAVPNQRFEGLAALVMLGEIFPDADGMAEVARKTNKAMVEYVTNGFNADGGMVEQSLNYNVVQAERFRQLGKLLRGHPPSWLPLLGERLIGFQRLLVGISTPMHELPVIGNNTSNPPAAWKGEDVRKRWFDRRRADGVNLDASALGFTSIAFPYSGYYVQRRDWAWDSPYLLMTNARPARGHQSMDNLAIEVHAYGRPLLIRGGPPTYGLRFLPADRRADAEKIDAYFNEESSYKLNTVIVDGYSQTRTARVGVKPYDQPVAGRWHATAEFDLVDGHYALGYGIKAHSARVDFSVTHQRRVIHVRGLSCWVVTDTLRGAANEEHEFTQIWKFPPLRGKDDGHNAPVCGFTPEQVTFREAAIRTVDPDGPNLSLYQFSHLPLTYTKHVGETDPYRGWYARFFGDLIPAVDMHATWRAKGASVVTTLAWPTSGANPPPIRSFARGEMEPTQDTSSFVAKLDNSDTLAFAESAAGPRQLKAAGIRITGETLLVTKQGRVVRGIVLGCKEWTDGGVTIRPQEPDFEFICRADGGFDTVAPIETPRGFRWVEGPNGFTPDYSDSLPATRVGDGKDR